MTQNQNQSSATKRISTYLTLIVLIVAALGIVAIILAGVTLVDNPGNSTNELTAGFFGIVGAVALVMSVFTLFQSRRQVAQMKNEIPKVMTTVECKCGSKTQREFQRGDYVYKELDTPCQKCPNTRQMVTAIYKEVKEKEKTYNV